MYKIVIDLEMCKAKDKNGKQVQEIVEIGAVLLDEYNEIIKEFSTYVKPVYGEITPELYYITHITDSDIASGLQLVEALELMYKTFEIEKVQNNYRLFTWSNTDSAVIKEELDLKEIEDYTTEYLLNRNTDIQKQFADRAKLKTVPNLENALNLVGLQFEGEPHKALTDAYNTARLLKFMHKNPNLKQVLEEVGHKVESIYEMKKLKTSLGDMIDFEALKQQINNN